MELFEVFRKRRACRLYRPDSPSDDILRKLVYAAQRAPTGGNTPYRHLVVVKAPVTVNLIRQVAPGFFGNPPVALVIYTDLHIATKELGRLGRDVCSLIDAGAAAENVVLAAASLGLGACFVKSYSETAVKEILKLPEHCRTEIIVALGYPAETQPAPLRPRPGAQTVYLDQFGQEWA
jgi:nitroreductase